MIQRSYITAWQKHAPWQTNEQIEQDLVISCAIVEIFSDTMLAERLAFRGGTALHKLHLAPAARYSEDIDLVQIVPGPIGPVFDRIKNQLSFLGTPRIVQKQRNNTLVFSFDSEIPPVVNLKLKVEINCREHDPVFTTRPVRFEVESQWFSKHSFITTYSIEELLSSKLRALYQRRKGRDLFDLWYALTTSDVSDGQIAAGFIKIMDGNSLRVSRRDFVDNMERKLTNAGFRSDITSLLRYGVDYDIDEAWNLVNKRIICLLA